MTRVLIPRSDNSSAKIIEASDWEKYFSEPILYDIKLSGLCVSAQCPNVLAVDVATGTARVKGLYLENTVTCSVTGLTACATNKIYVSICRDPACEPQGWVFGKTTGCIPADSFQIATATTNCSTVTSVDNTYITSPTHNLLGYVGTGTQINSLTKTYPGMLVYSTDTSGGFVENLTYKRNNTNSEWIQLSPHAIFGTGVDGCVTLSPGTTTLTGDMNYNNLCIGPGRTLNTAGYIVRVKGTLTNNGTITDSVSGGCAPAGNGVIKGGHLSGGGGRNGNTGSGPGGAGGAGGKGGGVVLLYVNTLTNNGTIHADGFNGANGSPGPPSPNGGYGGGGGGSGGRAGKVKIMYRFAPSFGTIRALGGTSGSGGPGGYNTGTGGPPKSGGSGGSGYCSDFGRGGAGGANNTQPGSAGGAGGAGGGGGSSQGSSGSPRPGGPGTRATPRDPEITQIEI